MYGKDTKAIANEMKEKHETPSNLISIRLHTVRTVLKTACHQGH
jgi:hypothetical protein